MEQGLGYIAAVKKAFPSSPAFWPAVADTSGSADAAAPFLHLRARGREAPCGEQCDIGEQPPAPEIKKKNILSIVALSGRKKQSLQMWRDFTTLCGI